MLNNSIGSTTSRSSYDMSTFDTDPFEPQPEGRHTIFPSWIPRGSNIKGEGSISSTSSFKVRHSPGGYVELPYTLPQDSTLFLLLGEKTDRIWRKKLDWIAGHGGMVLVNTHPDYMRFSTDRAVKRTYPVELYKNLLTYVNKAFHGDSWAAQPRQLARYFAAAFSHSPSVTSIRTPSIRRKRVCVVRHGHYPEDPRLRKQVTALLQQGHQVDVLCLRRTRAQPAAECTGNLCIKRLPVMHVRGPIVRYLLEYFSSFVLFTLYVSLRQISRRYDVIQVNTMPDLLAFCTIFAKKLGARVVVDYHEPTPELWLTNNGAKHRWLLTLQERILRLALRYADANLTVTKALKKNLEIRSGRNSIFVCPNVTLRTFGSGVPPLQMYSPDQFVLMTHGLIEHRYGHELVVDAVCKLANRIPNIVYEVLGEGEYRSVLETYVRARGCAHLVRFRGFVPFAELVNRVRSAHLGIVPMRRSPYSELIDTNKMYEYMLLGVPVIHSNLPVIADAIPSDAVELLYSGRRFISRASHIWPIRRSETSSSPG